MQELEIYVFGVVEGSLPQVMVLDGGGEAETLVDNLMGIFFSLLTYELNEGTKESKLKHNKSMLHCCNGNATT